MVCYPIRPSRQGEAVTLGDLAQVYLAQGDHDRAADHFTRALALSSEIGDRGNEAITLCESYKEAGGNCFVSR